MSTTLFLALMVASIGLVLLMVGSKSATAVQLLRRTPRSSLSEALSLASSPAAPDYRTAASVPHGRAGSFEVRIVEVEGGPFAAPLQGTPAAVALSEVVELTKGRRTLLNLRNDRPFVVADERGARARVDPSGALVWMPDVPAQSLTLLQRPSPQLSAALTRHGIEHGPGVALDVGERVMTVGDLVTVVGGPRPSETGLSFAARQGDQTPLAIVLGTRDALLSRQRQIFLVAGVFFALGAAIGVYGLIGG